MSDQVVLREKQLMTNKIKPHPCFSCSLPDCDDKAKACALRRAINTYDSNRKGKRPITPEIRAAYSHALRELYGHKRRERDALRRSAH